MIDPSAMSLSAVARRLPGRNGKHANPSTVCRWVQKGAVSADGRRVKLAAIRVGSTVYVTEAALAEFLLALNDPPAPPEAQLRSPTARRKASDKAAAELERMGA